MFDVRPATEQDLAAITAIENDAIERLVAHFGLIPIPIEATEFAFRSAQGKYPWYVATHEGEVIGFARASAWKAREAYNQSTEIGVYVKADFHGYGVATRLYNELFPELKRLGFHTLIAGITLPNDASVRLHEKFEMTLIGVFPEVGLKFGEWHSVGYWARVYADSDSPESGG